MGVWVVSPLAASKHKLKSQPIDESVFLEPYNYLIPMFLALNGLCFFKIVVDDSGVSHSDQYFQFIELKNFAEQACVCFLAFIDHRSLLVKGIDDVFGDEIE